MDLVPVVFIVQRQMFFDEEKGEMIYRFPRVDLAAKFGEIKVVYSPTTHPFKTRDVIEKAHRVLGSATIDDYFMPIGNVSLVTIASSIISYYLHGKIKLLHWSARDEDYAKIDCDLF